VVTLKDIVGVECLKIPDFCKKKPIGGVIRYSGKSTVHESQIT
jgi:hypothetical protein